MLWKIILFAILFPTLELYILILIGEALGAEITVGIVILTGVFGVFLAKKNASIIFNELLDSIKENNVPAMELIEGIIIILGGLFLFFPGLISDITGFILIFNPTRKFLIATYWARIKKSDFYSKMQQKFRDELIKKGFTPKT